MKKVRRWLAMVLLFALAMSAIPLNLAFAEELHIATDQTVYEEGDPIYVTATGSAAAKDWVGIRPTGDTGYSIYWYYITDATNGVAVDISTASDTVKTSTRPNPNDYKLPAGEYDILFIPNNGYAGDATETLKITINAKKNDAKGVRPEGAGTERFPYLIARAENLIWMSEQIGDGTQPTAASNPFAGVYFKQTQDIDLGGKTIPSIGYYFASADECAVFGGIYDGQGYRICNGSISEPNGSHEFSIKWGSGLFGAISGAVIRNVCLDNVSVSGLSVVGGIVGIASVDTEAAADETQNSILNCKVSDTCSVKATYVYVATNKWGCPGRVAGIVGLAMGTTIRYCVNDADISVLANITNAGGIAGTVGFGALVEHCVNNGDILLDNESNTHTLESGFGGIVGTIYPYGAASTVIGNVTIKNCYNTGNFQMKVVKSGAICYGGILGSFNTLTKGAEYRIENCYNLNGTNDLIDSTYRDIRIAGLVGCGFNTAGADCAQLVIRDSASVEITEGGCLSWYKSNSESCNEYVVRQNANKDGLHEVSATNVRTETADAIKTLTAAIDKAIAEAPTGAAIISTDKAVYRQGESIYVTANGSASAKDWVGIRPTGDTGNSIYWYYITDTTNGAAIDISKASDTVKTSTRPNKTDYDLPAGQYDILFIPNNGYAKDFTEVLTITITEHFSLEQTEFAEGGSIRVTATGSAAAKDWIGIRPTGDTGNSIYWYYITDATNGVAVDISTASDTVKTSSRPNVTDYELPAGKYDLLFVPSNGYAGKFTESITIEVVKPGADSAPAAPESITYELENATDGLADGTVTVTMPSGYTATSLLMYWVGEDGEPLAGYTSLAKFKITDTVTVHEMTANTIIPSGAVALRVYALSGTVMSKGYAEVTLPDGAASVDFGTPKAEFQVISDIHLNTDNDHLYNQNFKKVLEDIAANSANSLGIFINGDIANTGKASEYANMWTLYNSLKESHSNLPNLYLAVGNHDFFGESSYADGLALFLANAHLPDGTNATSVNYDFWIDGYHYIFLGSDRYPISNVNAYLSDEQLTWLDETLAADRDVDKPVFIFLHQSLYNTVAGSLEGQGWNGATPEAKLRAVLQKYPEAIMFNGHSHWTLNSESNMYERSDELPTIFNTSSTAYLWTSYNKAAGEALEGSEGYYIRIYEDKVVVLGRDFATGEWIPSACYVVDYSDMSAYEPTPIEPTDPSDPADTTGPIEADTNLPTDTNTDTDTDTAVQPVGGCQSAIGGLLAVFATLLLALPVLRRRRKRN